MYRKYGRSPLPKRAFRGSSSILDSLIASVAVLDQDGVIGWVNCAWCHLGRANEAPDDVIEPIGTNYLEICHRALNGIDAEYAAAAAAGIKRVMQREEKCFRQDYPCHLPHKERWFEMWVTPLRGTRGNVVVAHVEITDRKKLELLHFAELAKVRRLNEYLSLGEVLAEIGTWQFERSSNLIEWSPGLLRIMGLPPEGSAPSLGVILRLWHPDDRPRHREAIECALETGKGFTFQGRFIRSDGTVRHVRLETRCQVSALGVVTGLFGMVHDETAIRNANADLLDNIRRADNAALQTIRSMANLVELRDPYTSGHERRVGLVAADIARELGWSNDRCELLKQVGLLHDIGKIAIPSDILSKPKRLTSAEYELVKTHSEAGFDLLKDIDFPLPLAEIVRQHHERMDGSGYPFGLIGNAILPEARVLAVADVLESMASHRPYRPALGIDMALAELETDAFSLYDAEVVGAISRMIRNKGYVIPN